MAIKTDVFPEIFSLTINVVALIDIPRHVVLSDKRSPNSSNEFEPPSHTRRSHRPWIVGRVQHHVGA